MHKQPFSSWVMQHSSSLRQSIEQNGYFSNSCRTHYVLFHWSIVGSVNMDGGSKWEKHPCCLCEAPSSGLSAKTEATSTSKVSLSKAWWWFIRGSCLQQRWNPPSVCVWVLCIILPSAFASPRPRLELEINTHRTVVKQKAAEHNEALQRGKEKCYPVKSNKVTNTVYDNSKHAQTKGPPSCYKQYMFFMYSWRSI